MAFLGRYFVFVIITLAIIYISFKLTENKSNSESESVTIVKRSEDMTSTRNYPVETYYHDCDHFVKVKRKIEESMTLLWRYWDVSKYPYFLTTMHIPEESWEIVKSKYMKLLIDGNSGFGNSFVVGFSGSSVTAGHDNYFYEAYPQTFHNALKPVFSEMNVSFVVRNHAIGNNPCYAYDACVETHMGTDLDILTWEQSMNCGHNSNPIDTFTRAATRMHKKPIVLYLQSGSPNWSKDDCVKLNITTFEQSLHRKPFTAEETEIMKMSFKDIASKKATHMNNMDFLKDNKRHVNEGIVDRYHHFAPIGQNIFSIDTYKCYGPYNSSFSLKTPGGGAGWHPGRETHKFKGDTLAFYMLVIMNEAIDTILQVITSTSTPIVHNKDSKNHHNSNDIDVYDISGSSNDKSICNSKSPWLLNSLHTVEDMMKQVELSNDNNNKVLTSDSNVNSVKEAISVSSNNNQNNSSVVVIDKNNTAVTTTTVTTTKPDTSQQQTISRRIKRRKLMSHQGYVNIRRNLNVATSTSIAHSSNGTIDVSKIVKSILSTNHYNILTRTMDLTALEHYLINTGNTIVIEQQHSALSSSSSSSSSQTLSQLVSTSLLYIYCDMILSHVQGSVIPSNSIVIPPLNHEYNLIETAYPSICYTNFEPRMSHSLSDQVIDYDDKQMKIHSNWTLDLFSLDKSAVLKNEKLGRGYLDRKNIYLSNGINSTLILYITIPSIVNSDNIIDSSTNNNNHNNKITTPIWICECQKGFLKYPAYMGDLPDAIDIRLFQAHESLENMKIKTRAKTEQHQVVVDSSSNNNSSGGGGDSSSDGVYNYVVDSYDLLFEHPTHELELLSDQCYRTKDHFAPGNYLMYLTQRGKLQGNIAYVVTW